MKISYYSSPSGFYIHGKVIEADYGTTGRGRSSDQRIFPAHHCTATASWGWSPRIASAGVDRQDVPRRLSPGHPLALTWAGPVTLLVMAAYQPSGPVYRQPGTVLTDHTFTVPLDHRRPRGEQIEVFAREVVAADAARRPDLPWLLYLQGGPGGRRHRARRPGGLAGPGAAMTTGCCCWTSAAPAGPPRPTGQTLARLGTPRAQADYLAHFRADSIVADAELIRGQLTGGEPWSVLGQSFGGFCAVTYLSLAPEGCARRSSPAGCPGWPPPPTTCTGDLSDGGGQGTRRTTSATPQDVETAARQIAAHLAAHGAGCRTATPLTVQGSRRWAACSA